MYSHVMVGADDIATSKKFYDAVMGTLGMGEGFTDPNGRVFYSNGTANFAITKPINGQAASGANGGTIGFGAASPDQVDAWHAAGTANGGATCEDPPGWREMNGMKLYLAYLRDPAGNKLCALHMGG